MPPSRVARLVGPSEACALRGIGEAALLGVRWPSGVPTLLAKTCSPETRLASRCRSSSAASCGASGMSRMLAGVFRGTRRAGAFLGAAE
jgi:hypothetical protein